MNKIRVLGICLLATFIMSGLVTTIGLFTASAAEYYGVAITRIASQFSYFIGGIFLGYIFSFFVFDHCRMKTIIMTCYGIACIAIAYTHFFYSYSLLPFLLVVIGICASICACAGGTLITRLCQGKQRQTILVAQDAMFNGGGVLFVYTATFFIGASYKWTATYMVVAGVCVFVLILALISSFTDGEHIQSEHTLDEIKTEWNTGFICMGLGILLFLLAKISIFVWLPQFVEQNFNLSSESSGRLMSNIFMSAFAGSILSTYIVSKINVKYLLYSLVVLATISTWLFSQVHSMSLIFILGFSFGLSISATYNSYVALALTFVKQPTHRHIAYLLLAGGLGSALAPLFSSQMVEITGNVSGAIYMCTAVFTLCFVTLLISNAANNRKQRLHH